MILSKKKDFKGSKNQIAEQNLEIPRSSKVSVSIAKGKDISQEIAAREKGTT